MRNKIAIVMLVFVMGLSLVACSKSTEKVKPEGSAKPGASAVASKAPSTDASNKPAASAAADATKEPEKIYTQEQEIKFQSRDISGYVTLGEYKGVSVEAVDATVTDQDVEDKIQSVLKNNATYKDTAKDYKAANGDQVVIDFVGKVDGKAFDKGSADDQTLILGSHTYIEGFEEAIVGHTAGTTFDINVTFPNDYGNKEMAGKAAVFTITLDSIKNAETPELNDAFVQKTSTTSKTVAEFRKEVRDTLEKTAKDYKESKEEEAVWNAIIANCEVKEYPEDLVTYYSYNSKLQMTTQLASNYSISLEDYLKQTNTSEEEFTKKCQENAKSYMKQLMVLESIAKKENLDVTDEQYQTELKKVLDANSLKTEDDLKGKYGNLTTTTLKKSILYDNVTAFIVKNANIK